MATLYAPRGETTEQPTDSETALLDLLQLLDRRDYHFITPTPATHARVLARRAGEPARTLRDVLGWSMPFGPDALDAEVLAALRAADAIEALPGGRFRSRYRVSSLCGELYLHSAYPTDSEDAVFLGPDSYRFAALIERQLARCPDLVGARLADIGAGAGVGAIVAAKLCPEMTIVMTDINRGALRLARINAAAARVQADYAHGAGLSATSGQFDIILANPPYIIDEDGRDYRDGGSMHGGRAGYDMAVEAIDRLRPHGRFILYTGSAIVRGEDRFGAALAELAARHGCALEYREIDPDVFGEELDKPAYADVERIAVVEAVMVKGWSG